jgi:hypothetical protein
MATTARNTIMIHAPNCSTEVLSRNTLSQNEIRDGGSRSSSFGTGAVSRLVANTEGGGLTSDKGVASGGAINRGQASKVETRQKLA